MKVKDTKSYKVFTVFNTIVLLLIVVATLFPFLNVVAQSFSSENYINAGQVSIIPKGFNLDTYKAVSQDKMFWLNYWNTIKYTVIGTAISMFITTIFAYALSKKHLRGLKFFTTFAVFTMFFNGGMIPNYVLVRSLGWLNEMWAVVIPGALSIYNMLIMRSFFLNLPEELEEAAEMDGLGTYGILWRIVLPLSKPILATMVLFYAVGNWNSWFSAFLYFDKKELFPVTVYLRNMVKGATSANATGGVDSDNAQQVSSNIKAVTMVLTVLPILAVYPFVQKYFVSGIMLGSVKG